MASNNGDGHQGLLPNLVKGSPPMAQHIRYIKPPKDALGKFPEPMIVLPQLEHRQTIIILHGRGSFASKFAPPLLETLVDGHTLQATFPHAKLIFPTASKTKATIYKNPTHQWFDNWHLNDYTKRQYLMVEGLYKSCEFIHGLLREEIAVVGRENVLLWGLSQGCAVGLVSLLMWEGEGFAGVVGMCGWLPFGNEVERIAGGGGEDGDDGLFAFSEDEDDDLFARSESGDGERERKTDKRNLPAQTVGYLRETIDMEDKKGMVFQKIPVFLGHGTEDETVSIRLGREAKNCLELMGTDVQMKEYEGLGHWYSEDMLRNIFQFMKEKLKIKEKKT